MTAPHSSVVLADRVEKRNRTDGFLARQTDPRATDKGALPKRGSAWRNRSKRLYNATIGNDAAIAGIDHGLKLFAKGAQVGQLAIHLQQVLFGDPVDTGTIAAAVARDAQQCTNLIERKPKVAGTTDKGQSAKLRLAIVPVVARRPRRLGQQADLLVIADRLDLRGRSLAHIADRECHALDPVVATGPI